MGSNYRYRSFFWPGVLILVGLIALLVNTGQISADRIVQLVALWPVILIVIGLEIIVRRSLHGTTGDIAAALIVLLAVVGIGAYVAVSPNPAAGHTLDSTAQLGDLKKASVEVDVGAAKITISSGGDLGADLYHAHIDFSGPRPDISLDRSDGSLNISQQSNAFFGLGSHQFTLQLELNSSIPWTIAENTGASTDTIDVHNAHIAGITVNTGASREEITLGPAQGVVPIEINGGALTVRIHRATGTEASVDVSGGAITLNADGKSSHAIGELTYHSPGFNESSDGYKITVDGGALTVTLDQTASG